MKEDLPIHIFTVSAAMVGVCLTVIGLMRIVINLHGWETLVDDLLALDAFLFLTACTLGYWALRVRHKRRLHRVERIADGFFMGGIALMVLVAVFITYEIGFVR